MIVEEKDRIKARQKQYYERKKKELKAKANKWRSDKKIKEIAKWTGKLLLLDRAPIVVNDIPTLKKLATKYKFSDKPIIYCYGKGDKLYITREDGKGITILYEGSAVKAARELFINIKGY